MKKYVVIIRYSFDADMPTMVFDTHESAWKKILELVEEEKRIVTEEQGECPTIEMKEDIFEVAFRYENGDLTEYFIVEVNL